MQRLHGQSEQARSNVLGAIGAVRAPLFFVATLSLSLLPGKAEPVVDPTALVFTEAGQTNTLRLFNNEDREISWVVSALRWDHDRSGADSFGATSDVEVSPSAVSLEPHSGGALEVASKSGPQNDRESAYRIVLQSGADASHGFDVVYRMSVPVFLRPDHQIRSRAIAVEQRSAGQLEITIANNGNTHEFVKFLEVSATDEHGADIFLTRQSGWYILAHHARTYVLDLSTNDCRNASLVNASVEFRDGPAESLWSRGILDCLPDREGTAFAHGRTQMRPSSTNAR